LKPAEGDEMSWNKWYCPKCDDGKQNRYSVGRREIITRRDGSRTERAWCTVHPEQEMVAHS
jgi:hypothetical protein